MDDVHFLQKNAFKEEYVCVIDSAKRDKVKYPRPSHYLVEFNAPFTDVFGVDVIDVSIPRSGYIISKDINDNVRFRFLTRDGYTNWNDGLITPGNYTKDTILVELNRILKDKTDPVNKFIQVKPLTNPFEQSNKIVFYSRTKFQIDAPSSRASSVVGFNQETMLVNPISVRQPISDFEAPPYETIREPVFAHIPGQARYLHAVTKHKYPKQRVTPSIGGDFVTFTLRFGTIGYPASMSTYSSLLRFTVEELRPTRRVVFTDTFVISEAGEKILNWAAVDSLGTLSADFEYEISIKDEVNEDINNCWAVFHSYTGVMNTFYSHESGFDDVFYLRDHQLDMGVTINKRDEVIVPSGILDLFGERYIQLRCPEIEQHMYRHRAFEKHNVGLSIIYTSREYETLSQRFNALPSRTFHPIGKLKQLTFRFETSRGVEYDFNGIDHTVTLIIRYYRIREVAFEEGSSVLNPAYTPNVLEYFQQHGHFRDGDSDHEDDDNTDPYEFNHAYPSHLESYQLVRNQGGYIR